MEYPLMVPTLDQTQLSAVLSGQITPDIEQQARAHALARMLRGESPFAGPQDLRFPLP